VVYHWALLSLAVLSAMIYVLLDYRSPWQFLFLLALPLFITNALAVTRRPSEALDPWLKQMALSALLFTLLFGVGLMMA
jgi:1,4-dihydroxy-2-naphthoate octaprenyltransferase